MATIMSSGNSSGTKGRCDARCHNAKNPKCVCCCGGRFHGSARQPGGIEQAVRDGWDDNLVEAEKKAKEEGLELETERWAKNRQHILAKIKPVQGRLLLEVV
ncbi:hypothetical protein ES708_23018 [subsurface metagenome]